MRCKKQLQERKKRFAVFVVENRFRRRDRKHTWGSVATTRAREHGPLSRELSFQTTEVVHRQFNTPTKPRFKEIATRQPHAKSYSNRGRIATRHPHRRSQLLRLRLLLLRVKVLISLHISKYPSARFSLLVL